jgi:large subunit ribosomal protein L23
MAFLKSKKNTEVKKDAVAAEPKEKKAPKAAKAVKAVAPKVVKAVGEPRSYAGVLLGPRVTEKASLLSEKNVYAFEVSPRAQSEDIKRAIFEMFKVRPVKVAVLTIRRKKVMSRGRQGMRSGGRKAYVYLKEGDKIELV